MGINLRNKRNINKLIKKETVINLKSEVHKELSKLDDLINNNKLK